MKIFFQVLFTLISIFSYSQVRWMNINQALEAQKKEPKKIFISFTENNCMPCQKMLTNAFINPIIAKVISDHFYPVQFNVDSTDVVNFNGRNFQPVDNSSVSKIHPFAKFMNISSVPTLVFLDENSNVITSLTGDLSAKDLEPYFSIIGSEAYKNIKTRQQWDDYQKKFRSKIKD